MNLKLGKPRSVRFSPDTETFLEQAAAKEKIGFATLVSGVMDDYVKWLRASAPTYQSERKD